MRISQLLIIRIVNFFRFFLSTLYSIWDWLSQKTISRYCHVKRVSEHILIFLQEAFICRTTVRLRCAQSELYPAPPHHSPQLPSADAHSQSQIMIVDLGRGLFGRCGGGWGWKIFENRRFSQNGHHHTMNLHCRARRFRKGVKYIRSKTVSDSTAVEKLMQIADWLEYVL